MNYKVLATKSAFTAILGSLQFVVAFAWNDFFKDIFQLRKSQPSNTYPLIILAVLIAVTMISEFFIASLGTKRPNQISSDDLRAA